MTAKITDKDRWATSSGWSDLDNNNHLDKMHYGLEYRRKQNLVPQGVAAPAPQILRGSGPSNSDMYIRQAAAAGVRPETSQRMSQTRQEYLQEINERAMTDSRPNLGIASTGPAHTSLRKQASVAASSQGRLSSSSNSTQVGPDVYSPLFLTQNMMLPRDRATANAWNRAFFETNPYVRNAITLHATYPISKLNIKCEDKKIEQFFQDMADKVDLQTAVQNASSELWKLGECFNYANFDESTGCWDHIYQHNPDYIRVRGTPLQSHQSIISLKADAELEKIITSSDPEHIRIREQIDPKIIHHVLMNEAIPLDNFNVSHLKMVNAPYDIRGTSIITSVWKHLMWMDKILECKLAQADGMINPMTLITLGENGPDGWYPRQDELDAWRSVFEQAQFDKDFKIITHQGVKVERVGFSGATIDTTSDMNFIVDSILTGLMVPKSILTQEGASYSSASVALDVMRQRYNSFRTMMANWIERKIFAPISEVQGFYKLVAGKKKLIVPEIEWNHMTLHDIDTYIANIVSGVGSGTISQRTLDYSLGLNRNNEVVNIRQELIEKAIAAREAEAIGSMTLADLRALDPEEPIISPEKSALPGVSAISPAGGGGAMDLGMPPSSGPADLGSLPGGEPGFPPTPPG